MRAGVRFLAFFLFFFEFWGAAPGGFFENPMILGLFWTLGANPGVPWRPKADPENIGKIFPRKSPKYTPKGPPKSPQTIPKSIPNFYFFSIFYGFLMDLEAILILNLLFTSSGVPFAAQFFPPLKNAFGGELGFGLGRFFFLGFLTLGANAGVPWRPKADP